MIDGRDIDGGDLIYYKVYLGIEERDLEMQAGKLRRHSYPD
jgi:hypothetical protein